jgi:DNA-binding CsgD family transcriptional regulator
MFETFLFAEAPALQRPARPIGAAPYSGPERRDRRSAAGTVHIHARGSEHANWLSRMLDEVDHGMLLVAADGEVSYFNHAARLVMDEQHPLQMLGSSLRARHPQDVAPLYDALAGAQRGLRKLLHLGEGTQRVGISVVPLPGADHLSLVVLSKRHFCQTLSVQAFARGAGMTPAETRVLAQLCDGVSPSEIAQSAGVAVSTVRSQIGSIRTKTGAASIHELVRQVAVLPPMLSALRGGLLGGVVGPVVNGLCEQKN